MLADVSPVWGIAQSAITAVAGLGGVGVGAFMTGHNQKKERKNARIKEQLQDFYSPLLALRAEIKAKSEFRLKVRNAAGSAWTEKFGGERTPERSQSISERDGPVYDKIIDYDNKQLEDELIPQYQKMIDCFSTHLWLANASTLKHYSTLVEYVEVWNRYLAKAIPGEVVRAVSVEEKMLYPLYEDLQRNFDALNDELCK
jgi:hypothetical protein